VEEGITQWFKGLRRTCDEAGVVGGKNGSRCYSSLNHEDGGKGFGKMAVLVPGVNRHIQDNILIAQELLKGYNKKSGSRRCAMKIDLQKSL
nr:RNA-directed DNA polymerase, eukaryota, reverse transcriptase zinc-binding domain protein [Tanacetum cinerariifolium]